MDVAVLVRELTEGVLRDRRGPGAKRVVDLTAQLAAYDRVHGGSRQRDRKRDGEGRRERQSRAEAHASRSA